MYRQDLSQYFEMFVLRRLTAVEVDPESSNQHEFNGVKELKALFGTERQEVSATFIYLSEEDREPLVSSGSLTWYDAREKHPFRTEFRLYFRENEAINSANADDLLFVGKRPSGDLMIVIAEAYSTADSQLRWLARASAQIGHQFELRDRDQAHAINVGFVERLFLEQLGISTFVVEPDLLKTLQARFGNRFPGTADFSAFARELAGPMDAAEDPDKVLLAWMDQEEVCFRTMERFLLEERLEEGFGNDVDAFIQYSLSVQNRRKSRVGHAFEHHLSRVFIENDISFTRGAQTENRSKPDFVFPGISAYWDEQFPEQRLTMLGAKTTCKDRWRQILSEAKRISEKHLITLEPSISETQTTEMRANAVRLVIPSEIQSSYLESQRSELLSVSLFIEHLRETQS